MGRIEEGWPALYASLHGAEEADPGARVGRAVLR